MTAAIVHQITPSWWHLRVSKPGQKDLLFFGRSPREAADRWQAWERAQ